MAIGEKVFGLPYESTGTRHGKGFPLSVDDKVFILWGLAHHWSSGRIADRLPAARWTVWKFTKSITDDPSIIARLPVVKLVGKRKFACRFCGEKRNTKIKAFRHVMSHVLPLETARDYPIGEVKSELL